MKHLKVIIIFVCYFSFNQAEAQFTGEGSINNKEIKTIKYVKSNANKLDRSDLLVKLKGHITEQINHEDFWFRDSTGKIKIEIDLKNMPQTPFNDKTELIIIGEVDADWLEGVELEVEQIQFIKSQKQSKGASQ